MRAPTRLVLPLAVLLAALGSFAGRAPAGEELSPVTDPSSPVAALASKLALSEPDFYDLSEAGVERVQDELSEALRGGGKKKGPPSSGPRQPPPTLLALGAPARVIVEALTCIRLARSTLERRLAGARSRWRSSRNSFTEMPCTAENSPARPARKSSAA